MRKFEDTVDYKKYIRIIVNVYHFVIFYILLVMNAMDKKCILVETLVIFDI